MGSRASLQEHLGGTKGQLERDGADGNHSRLRCCRCTFDATSPLLLSLTLFFILQGVAAAVLSHPADTLLSKINQGKGGKGSIITRLSTLAVETGPVGLFAGLGPRTVMTVGLVSSQFLMYSYLKKALGADKSVELHKD